MFKKDFIKEWGDVVPWEEDYRLLQDLVISRALVEFFSDEYLRDEHRYRGGTALNKLHYPESYRYSEDIDMARMKPGPNGPVLDRLREILEPWLGEGQYKPSQVASKLLFEVANLSSEGRGNILKLEMSYKDKFVLDRQVTMPFQMSHTWFSGSVEVPAFSSEEVLASKLRALLGRNKGRDLLDHDHALRNKVGLDIPHIMKMFGEFAVRLGPKISRAAAQMRMFGKMEDPYVILDDMKQVLPKEERERLSLESVRRQFKNVFEAYIELMPGKEWAFAEARSEQFGLDLEIRKGRDSRQRGLGLRSGCAVSLWTPAT